MVFLQRVAPYQYGESRESLVELNAFIRSVDSLAGGRAALEEEFLGCVKGNGTPAARNFVLTKLALVGGERSGSRSQQSSC